MATSAELLVDGFGRIRESVADVLGGLTAEQLAYEVDADRFFDLLYSLLKD